jgi:hypothetical protein
MKTKCKWGHLLTEENTYRWRGERRCRVCHRVRQKLWKRKSNEDFGTHLQDLEMKGVLYFPMRGPLGWEKPGRKATETPSLLDIAWAAGVFEGEGCCTDQHQAVVVQKDTWLLYKLQALFGGKVSLNYWNGCSRWVLTGSRARGFLMTVFSFLSPKRKMQVLSFIGKAHSPEWRMLRKKYPAELSRPH